MTLVVVLSVAAEAAWATIDNQKSYKAAYPDKDPKAYSCKLCHDGAMGNKDNLNAYGKALKSFKATMPADAKKLTAEDYQAFDAADADGDGATNAQELEAQTDLLDPESVPVQDETVKKNDIEVKTPTEPQQTKEGGR
ncbi:MAG: hypothetical protein HY595_04720 [Candidatus Omnitrophica bacterium]|nr:hypothetical protein [Candidatus Omnitrophota bacterium]